MIRNFRTTIAALAVLNGGCGLQVSSGVVEPSGLQNGMTKQDVISVLGQPTSSAVGIGGLDCLTYVSQHPGMKFLSTVQIVVLTDGKLVRHAKSQPFDASAHDAIAKAGPQFSCKI